MGGLRFRTRSTDCMEIAATTEGGDGDSVGATADAASAARRVRISGGRLAPEPASLER